jgi:hypothetical protein
MRPVFALDFAGSDQFEVDLIGHGGRFQTLAGGPRPQALACDLPEFRIEKIHQAAKSTCVAAAPSRENRGNVLRTGIGHEAEILSQKVSHDLFRVRFAEYKIGGFSTMTKLSAMAPAIAGFTILTFSLSTGAAPARAFEARTGQLHIVKDCAGFTGVAGSSTCKIVSSNLDEIPAGSLIYYDQPTGGPAIGTYGFLDSNIFVYVKAGQWAVGRCTLDNNSNLGVCTLSYGSGPLATISATVNVTYHPGGDGALYNWDGTYTFNPSGN